MLDSDGLFSGACPSCGARITRVAQCPECGRVFAPPQAPAQIAAPDARMPGPAFYGGTPPANRRPGQAVQETLPGAVDLAAAHRAEAPFIGHPSNPEPGDRAQPGDDS